MFFINSRTSNLLVAPNSKFCARVGCWGQDSPKERTLGGLSELAHREDNCVAAKELKLSYHEIQEGSLQVGSLP